MSLIPKVYSPVFGAVFWAVLYLQSVGKNTLSFFSGWLVCWEKMKVCFVRRQFFVGGLKKEIYFLWLPLGAVSVGVPKCPLKGLFKARQLKVARSPIGFLLTVWRLGEGGDFERKC